MLKIRNLTIKSVRILRLLALVPVCVSLMACGDPVPRDGGDILVLGDSVMAWNRSANASIPQVLGRALDRSVISKAVPGAQFDNASSIAGAVGFDIQRQLPRGRWNWLVINGGANDLGSDCGCGACGAVVDQLIGADATGGAIPEFIKQVQSTAVGQVVWMGYYAGSGRGSFTGCRDDLVELEKRLARFAATQPRVSFIDSEDVIDRKDRTHFASDNIHPSAKGSTLIGTYLAQHIKSRSARP